MHKWQYFAVSCCSILLNFAPTPLVLAQEPEKPAIAPIPRTINLTQEQRFIIKENLKDLHLPKASSNAPETIGDVVPENITSLASVRSNEEGASSTIPFVFHERQ